MKRLSVLSVALPLLLLFPAGNALAQVFGPEECALTLDPDRCCDRPADEETRVETARSILKVNARTDPETGEKDVDHYHTVINYWAVRGSGESGVGEEGAVYVETVLSNYTRQEMWDYLDVIFRWSADMELVTFDELWETHEDNSMTYMVVNNWFGSTAAGRYEQPGISIVKFRPDEGCASYQRDYFSEGDTWWGMDFSQDMVRTKRERVITELGLTHKCVDDDGDGYTKYLAATGCPNEGLDCNDYDASIYPGAPEICDDGIDNNCSGRIDCWDPDCFGDPVCPPVWGAASTTGQRLPPEGSNAMRMNPVVFYLGLPLLASLLVWRLYRRKSSGR